MRGIIEYITFKKLVFTGGVFILFFLVATHNIFAAEKNLTIGYEPLTPNFSTGSKNLVYVVLLASSDTISAAKIAITSTGGVQIVDILDPVDSGNKTLPNTRIVGKTMSKTAASETILLVQNTKDLPTLIKLPIVVVSNSGKAGNIQVVTKESQVVNGIGNNFSLQQPKKNYITFSENGKDTSVVPTPTPLPSGSMILNITTKLQGVSKEMVKTKTIENVKVQLAQKNGASVRTSIPKYMTMSMDDAGKWHGSVVVADMTPGENYKLLIKGPKHLQKRICETNPSETKLGAYTCNAFSLKLEPGQNTLDISNISLIAGDVGLQDGILNAYDLTFVQNVIKKTSSNGNDADINFDGIVNNKDNDVLLYSLKNTSGLDEK